MGINKPDCGSKLNTTAASASSSLRAWSTLISATARTSRVPLAIATWWSASRVAAARAGAGPRRRDFNTLGLGAPATSVCGGPYHAKTPLASLEDEPVFEPDRGLPAAEAVAGRAENLGHPDRG